MRQRIPWIISLVCGGLLVGGAGFQAAAEPPPQPAEVRTIRLQPTLTAPSPDADNLFGTVTAVGEEAPFVGAIFADVDDITESGATFAYRDTGDSWERSTRLTARPTPAPCICTSGPPTVGPRALVWWRRMRSSRRILA
ncbi:MAG: hypothetical protein ABEK29_02350, partial [Bradymonadaceae bacterium]